MTQDGIGRKIHMSVLDIVNVARNVDQTRTGLNTGARHGAEEAVLHVNRRRVHFFGEELQRSQERHRTGLANAAQRGLRHLFSNLLHRFPFLKGTFLHGFLKIAVQKSRSGATGRAFATGLGGHFGKMFLYSP